MKRIIGMSLILLILLSAMVYSNDNSISIGFENAFGYRHAKSDSITYNNINYENQIDYEETNSIVAPGFNIFGRFLNDRGIGGFFRSRFLFPTLNN
jgi:hypothetical protein